MPLKMSDNMSISRSLQHLDRLQSRRWMNTGLSAWLLLLVTAAAISVGRADRAPLNVPPDTVIPTETDPRGLAAGNTAGSLEVSSGGDLLYNFPLWIPPGRNGVQPEISLSYRSRASNGLVGVGWSIGGLSAISRCAQNTAENGRNAPIAFDSTDRFCLDEQQLIPFNGGPNGPQYVTESDYGAKIVSGGDDGEGPGWFKVYLRNGRILYYGTTEDSRLEGQRVHTFPVAMGGASFAQSGAMTSWISITDNTSHIGYIGQDGHVYEIRKNDNSGWTNDDLTAITGAPPAQGGAITSWVSSTDNVQHLAYIDHRGHIIELYMPVGQPPWRPYSDPHDQAGAPAAQQGALTSWVSSTDNVQHMAYIDHRGHVIELYMPVGQPPWRPYSDPHDQAGAPAAQQGALTSWVTSTDNVQHMAYIDQGGDVIELYMPVGQPPWRPYSDPNNQAGAKAAQQGALISWFSSADSTQHIAYIGQDSHPDTLSMIAGQPPWGHFIDFTAGSTEVGISSSQTVRLVWALARVEDRYGNGINYSYTLQQTASSDYNLPTYEFRPDTITYTDTADKSWPALKSIKFVYEARPDVRPFYMSGLRMTYANRLSSVEIRGPNPDSPELLRTYKLTYRNDSVTNRSLLSTITECDGRGVCKAPVKFEWELGSMAFFDIATGIHDDSSSNQTTPSVGGRFLALASADINGDGLDDLLFCVADGATAENWYYLINQGYKAIASLGGQNIFTGSPMPIVQPGMYHSNVRFVDMDRDGLADLIVTQYPDNVGGPTSVQVYLSTPTSPFSNLILDESSIRNSYPLSQNSYVADINGDGFPDILITQDAQTWNYNLNSGRSGVGCGAPGLFGCITPLPEASGIMNIFAVDVDGDGNTQVMLRNPVIPWAAWDCVGTDCSGVWYMATKISNGNVVSKNVGLLAGEVFPNGTGPCWGSRRLPVPCFSDLFFDLNGDGLPDALSVDSLNGGAPWIAINTGNGFLPRKQLGLTVEEDGASNFFPAGASGCLIADLNHEGREDALLVATGPVTGRVMLGPVALLSTDLEDGSIGFKSPFHLQDQNGDIPLADNPIHFYRVGPVAVLADLNGDGLPDMIQVVNGELHVYIRTSRLPDVITRVVEGMGAEHTISWQPISNPDVHQIVSTSSFPTIPVKNGIWVVSDVASSDAAGGTRHFTYKYINGRADALGLGWLGFEQRQETDSATGIVSVTTFDNSTRRIWQQGSATTYVYPFVGMPQTESFGVALDNGDSFSWIRTTNYLCRSGRRGPPYTVLPTQVVEKVFDASPENIGPISQITTTTDYDLYANPWRVSRVTGDGYSCVTYTSYYVDLVNWLIGVAPTQVIETQQTPSGESTTRTTKYDIDPNTGFIVGRTIEPTGDSSLKLSLQLSRDNTGLVFSVQETSADQQRNEQIFYDNLEHAWPAYTLNPLYQIDQYAYHPSFGILAAFQDKNNNLTRWQVDGFGRLRIESPPDGAQTTISYSNLLETEDDYTIAVHRAGGQEIQSFINGLGLEYRHSTRGFDGRQIWIDKAYDSAGRLILFTNPYFDAPTGDTSLTYDALGRIRKVKNPDGTIIEKDYSGLTTTVWDENRNRKAISTDELSRPILITEEASSGDEIQTRLTYGPFGVLDSVADPAGNKIEAQYDCRGRRKLLIDPDSGSLTTGWNAFDEVVSGTNGLGDPFQYKRDPLGRPFNITSKEGTTTIVWDQAPNGIGKIANATSTDSITTVFSYDSLSKLSSEEVDAEGKKFLFSYLYDSFGRLKTIKYPAPERVFDLPQFAVSFDYTDYGDLKDVTDTTSADGLMFWQNTARNEFEQITGEVFANGVSTSRAFDARARLWSLETVGSSFPVQSLIYQYYANGNLQSRTDRLSNVIEGYDYDSLNRLTQWDIRRNDSSDLSQRFCYDDIGNLRQRLTLYGSGDNLTYEYSGIHAGPHAVTSINGANFDYDAAGREKVAPDRKTEYKSWGLPKQVAGAQLTDRFKYDFREQRTLKLRSDGKHVATVGLFQRASQGNTPGTNTYYVPAAGRIVAAVVLDESSKNRSVYYLHDDRLGSIAAITKQIGQGVDAHAYDPFGTTREATDPSISTPPSSLEPLGFTERELDPEDGLLNMLGRLYDPKISRFTTPDPFVSAPISSQSYNRYSYVQNNPFRWTDPTGLQDEGEEEGEEDQGGGYTKYEWEPTPVAPSPVVPLDVKPATQISDDDLGRMFQPLPAPAPNFSNYGWAYASVEPNTESDSEPDWNAHLTPEEKHELQVYFAELHKSSHPFEHGFLPGLKQLFTDFYHYFFPEARLFQTVIDKAHAAKWLTDTDLEVMPVVMMMTGMETPLPEGSLAPTRTGTVWDAIVATQPSYEGTVIPRSFELATKNGSIWVAGNASEHLAEYAVSMLNRGVSQDLVNIGSQSQLQSLQSAVETATANGMLYDQLITVGGWELKFGAPREAGQLPALIHAMPVQ